MLQLIQETHPKTLTFQANQVLLVQKLKIEKKGSKPRQPYTKKQDDYKWLPKYEHDYVE